VNKSLIVAMSTNHVIGHQGKLPWHIPEDLRYFKAMTLGKPVVMGRKTHESIGFALPGRLNIVLTCDRAWQSKGCLTVYTLEDAWAAAGDAEEVMVIGGAALYSQVIACVDRMYITRIHTIVEGDAYFPEFDPSDWRLISSQTLSSDRANGSSVTFEILERD
jgi:dihydrofolate reductase